MTGPSQPNPADHLIFDNKIRFAVCAAAVAIATVLHASGMLVTYHALLWIAFGYSIPTSLSWIYARRFKSRIEPLLYFLSFIDFCAITGAVALTGGPDSPFF